MDACVDACHPHEDRAAAWTPESEAGGESAGPFDPRAYAAEAPADLATAATSDDAPGRLAFLSLGFLGVFLILLGVLLQCRAPATDSDYAAVAADDDDGDAPEDPRG